MKELLLLEFGLEVEAVFLLWTDRRSLVVKSSPVPAGTVEACSYEQDDQQGDKQTEGDDRGSDGPDERRLGEVDHGRA